MTVQRDSIIDSSLTIIHNNKRQDDLWLNSWSLSWPSRLLWFSGILCTATSERCLSGPCQNGASCVDTVDDYACICPTGGVRYMGKNCDELYDACFFAPCENCTSTPGSTEYQCICTDGLSGDNCTEEVDECRSSPCSYPRSLCVDQLNGYFCRCPEGFGGRDCRAHVTDCIDGPCMNNGTCVLQPEGFECDCAPGFEGETCEEDMDECLSEPCQNGAICTNGVAEFHCFCVPGFQGYNCELDINECASRPCENNATCINEKDHYECECLMGFAGKNTPCLTVWTLAKHKLQSLLGWYRKASTLTNALCSLHQSPFPLLLLSLLYLFPTNWVLHVPSKFSDVRSGIIYDLCLMCPVCQIWLLWSFSPCCPGQRSCLHSRPTLRKWLMPPQNHKYSSRVHHSLMTLGQEESGGVATSVQIISQVEPRVILRGDPTRMFNTVSGGLQKPTTRSLDSPCGQELVPLASVQNSV